ncbi:hypothetical protein KM043_010249 [Ampulex compressa]|nr:hypothetical protein KM043_010249 [Ampulex compressa]
MFPPRADFQAEAHSRRSSRLVLGEVHSECSTDRSSLPEFLKEIKNKPVGLFPHPLPRGRSRRSGAGGCFSNFSWVRIPECRGYVWVPDLAARSSNDSDVYVCMEYWKSGETGVIRCSSRLRGVSWIVDPGYSGRTEK